MKREGEDLTVVTYGYALHLCLEAAERLASDEGISVEVVDVRSLSPLDTETILASVRKTSKAMVVYEDNRTYGAGAEIAATIAEEAMFDLDAPIVRIGGPDIPAMPFAGALEHFYMEPEPDHLYTPDAGAGPILITPGLARNDQVGRPGRPVTGAPDDASIIGPGHRGRTPPTAGARRARTGAVRDLLVLAVLAVALFALGSATGAWQWLHDRLDRGTPAAPWTSSTPPSPDRRPRFAGLSIRRRPPGHSEAARRVDVEDRFRAVIEEVPAITYTWNPTKPAGDVDDPLREPADRAVLGFTQEEWTSDPMLWIEHLHPEDRDRVVAESDRTDRTGAPFAMEYRIFTKDGREVWLRDESRGGGAATRSGRPEKVQGVMFDITPQKRAEEALQEAENRYRTIVERVPAVAYVWDAADRPGHRARRLHQPADPAAARLHRRGVDRRPRAVGLAAAPRRPAGRRWQAWDRATEASEAVLGRVPHLRGRRRDACGSGTRPSRSSIGERGGPSTRA